MFRPAHREMKGDRVVLGPPSQRCPAGALATLYRNPSTADVQAEEGATTYACRGDTPQCDVVAPAVHRNGTPGRTPLTRVASPEDPCVEHLRPDVQGCGTSRNQQGIVLQEQHHSTCNCNSAIPPTTSTLSRVQSPRTPTVEQQLQNATRYNNITDSMGVRNPSSRIVERQEWYVNSVPITASTRVRNPWIQAA
jgi:hypothetical protein